MALTPKQAYALSKKYTADVTKGIELIQGKPCTIKSIESIGGGKRITYQWTADDGTVKTQTMDVMDGEKGDKGDPGNQGIQGVPGPRGTNGTAATITIGSVTSGESPSVTNAGTQQDAILNFILAKGDKGDKGEKGNDGQNGSSFSIRSRFATYEELIAAFPDGPENEGDAYFVGTTSSPDLYIWLVEESEWHNNGPIAGIKGDKGDQGEEGFSPVANVTKDGNISTITVRDKTGTTTAQVKDGYSPTMSVSKSGDVITVEVTDESGTTEEILDLSGKVNTTDVGTTAYKNTTEYVSPLDEDIPTSRAVYRAMSNAIYGAYHPSGSKTVSELTSDLLVQANVGNVYKITDSGITTDLFIEGAGITINAGDNAVVVYASENTFKFDLQSGVVDLSGYQEKELPSGAMIEDIIPSDASASNKLATASDALIYYQSDSSSITDFNNAVPQTGKGAIQMFYLGSDITNSPTSSGGGFIVVAEQLSTTYISQLATQIGTNNKYTRSKSTSGWGSWQKLVTESDLYADETTVTVTSDSSGSGSSSNITLQRSSCPYYVIAAGNNYGSATWLVQPSWSTSLIVKLGGGSTVTCTHVSTTSGKPTIQVGIVNQPNVSIQFKIKPVR